MYIAISGQNHRFAVGRTVVEAVNKLTQNFYNLRSLKAVKVYKTDGGAKEVAVSISIK